MTILRADIKRNEENRVEHEVPLQGPIVPIGDYVYNEKIRY